MVANASNNYSLSAETISYVAMYNTYVHSSLYEVFLHMDIGLSSTYSIKLGIPYVCTGNSYVIVVLKVINLT